MQRFKSVDSLRALLSSMTRGFAALMASVDVGRRGFAQPACKPGLLGGGHLVGGKVGTEGGQHGACERSVWALFQPCTGLLGGKEPPFRLLPSKNTDVTVT